MATKSIGLRGIVAVAAALALPRPMLAAEADSATVNTSSEPMLGEVIVTAQKRSERIQDVPLSITAQSAEQLKRAGVTSTADLDVVVPGLVFAQNEAYVQPSIRGVTSSSTVAGAENPIAIYLDGIYQPSPIGVLFDLPDVDRIEVLKGPQGTLFGRNATGGAIQIFTREPSFKFSGDLEATSSLYQGGAKNSNENGGSAYITGPLIGDVLAGSISLYYREDPGYLQNDVDGSRAGKDISKGFRAALLWQPAENMKFVFTGYYTKDFNNAAYDRAPYRGLTLGANFSDAVVPTQPWHLSFQPGNEYYADTTSGGASLKGEVKFNIGTLTSITGYSDTRNTDFVAAAGVYSPSCVAAFACLVYNLQSPSRAVSEELDFASRQFGMVSFTSGLYYFHNFSAGQYVDVDGSFFTYREDVATTAEAFFSELTIQPIDSLRFIFGGRFNHEETGASGEVSGKDLGTYSRENNNSVTPRFSSVYSLTGQSNVYFTFSKGFKSGVLPLPVNITPPTSPEKLTSYEVGFKSGGRNYSFDASVYHYDYTNLQQTVFVGALAFPKNAAAAVVDGIDLDATYSIDQGLQFTTGLSYVPRAEFQNYPGAVFYRPSRDATGALSIAVQNASADGIRMLRAPMLTGNLGFNWSHQLGPGKIGLNSSLYHSSSFQWDLAANIKTDAYNNVTAQAYFEPDAIRGLRVTVFGKNLTDAAHVVGSQPSSNVIPALYGSPRQVGINVGYRF